MMKLLEDEKIVEQKELEEESYSIPNEGSCSHEFSEGCILSE